MQWDGGRDAGGETTRETENLAAWGCEPTRGRRAAREILGVGRVGRQNSRFSVFQRADTQKSMMRGRYLPILLKNSKFFSRAKPFPF